MIFYSIFVRLYRILKWTWANTLRILLICNIWINWLVLKVIIAKKVIFVWLKFLRCLIVEAITKFQLFLIIPSFVKVTKSCLIELIFTINLRYIFKFVIRKISYSLRKYSMCFLWFFYYFYLFLIYFINILWAFVFLKTLIMIFWIFTSSQILFLGDFSDDQSRFTSSHDWISFQNVLQFLQSFLIVLLVERSSRQVFLLNWVLISRRSKVLSFR
jgi:hypothetical protein